jgi:hypothetical protein
VGSILAASTAIILSMAARSENAFPEGCLARQSHAASIHSFDSTKISLRSMPEARISSPTFLSLPYAAAV